MAEWTAIELVRTHSQEPDDTTFSDEQITAWLDLHDDDAYAVASIVWTIKAAMLARRFNLSTGNQRLDLNQQWSNAMEMAKRYESLASVAINGGDWESVTMANQAVQDPESVITVWDASEFAS